jgi:hypothetical protein
MEISLKDLLVPKDPLDKKNITSNPRRHRRDEAALFASVLFRIISALRIKGWRWKSELQCQGLGGFKESLRSSRGRNLQPLKYEARSTGPARSGNRIQGAHSYFSVTVAVYRKRGGGYPDRPPAPCGSTCTFFARGQASTLLIPLSGDSISHRLVVTCQEEKSQHKN